MESEIIAPSPDCEIVDSRIFNAPVAMVFKAWATPEHLQNWWGPAGFTNTFHTFDFREGGKWSFTMHGPDKGNYQNECEFLKIGEPTLIYWKRHSKPLFRVLATFEAVSESQTKVVFRQIFDSEAECSKIRKYTAGKNDENFDKLEQELSTMIAGKQTEIN